MKDKSLDSGLEFNKITLELTREMIHKALLQIHELDLEIEKVKEVKNLLWSHLSNEGYAIQNSKLIKIV